MRTVPLILASILVLTRRHLVRSSVEIDNALLGVPEIDCHADTIEMRFRTKRKFTGKIYVQGHADNPDCRVDYGRTTATGEPIGGIRLHHGSCDMNRRRSTDPEGMEFSTILVISFHPIFVTKTDRAFNINCMYRETAKTVDAGLTVSPIEPDSVQYDMPLPQCHYTIRKDNLDGPILHYAKVGDQVFHRWECNSDAYGMLVHSCYVEDGQGEKQLVIDKRGCHVDRIALGDPTYVTELNMAYRESNVFKFADRVGVRFACEIKLCMKESGGCKGITPPICNDFQKDQKDLSESDVEFIPYHDEPLTYTTAILNYTTTTVQPVVTVSGSANTNEQHGYYVLSAKAKRHATSSAQNIRQNSTTDLTQQRHRRPTTVATDLISQYVYVLDTIDDTTDAEFLEGRQTDSNESSSTLPASSGAAKRLRFVSSKSVRDPSKNVCMSARTLFAMAIAAGATFAAALIVILHLVFRQIRTSKQLKSLDRLSTQSQITPANFLFK